MSCPRVSTSVSEQFLAPWSSDALIAEVYSLAGEKGLSTRWTSVLSAKLKIELPNGDSNLNAYLQEAPKESLIACVTALRTELEASTSVRSRRKSYRRRPSATKQKTSQEKRQARETRRKTKVKITGQHLKCSPNLAQPRQSMDVEIDMVNEQETSVGHLEERILAVQHMQQYKFTVFEAQIGDMKRETELYKERLLGKLAITQQTIDSAATALQSNPTIRALAGGEFINIRHHMEEQALAMLRNKEQLREAQNRINENRGEIKYLKTQLDKVQEEIRQGFVERRTSVTSADSFSEAYAETEKATVSTFSVESTPLHGSYPAEPSRSHCIAESGSIPTSTSAARILAGMSQTSKWVEDNMTSSEPVAVNTQCTPMFAEAQQVHERLLNDVGLGDYCHYTIDSGSGDLHSILGGITPKCCGRIPHALTNRGCILCDQHCLQFTTMTPQQMGTAWWPGFCCPACSDQGCKSATALNASYVEDPSTKSFP
ncbi:hypothetical protein RBB50_012699 [Rhinocladiella similis]